MPSNWTIIKITVALELWVFVVYLTDCFIENYGAKPFIRNYYGAENVYGLATFLYGSRIRRHLLNGTISIFSGQLNVFDCPGANLTDHVLWKYNNTTFHYRHGNRFYPFGVAFVLAPAEESDSGLYECYVDHKLRGSAVVDVTMKAKVLIAVFLGYFILLVTAVESQAKSPDSGETSSRGSKKKKSSKKAKSSKGKVKNPDDSNSKDSNSSKKKKKSGSGSKGKKKRSRPKGKGKSKSKPKKEPTSEPISDEFEGESLGECSEKEWEGAEAAYNPTLINLKKKQNRVTVFAATKKIDKKKAPGDPDKEPSQVLVAVGSEALPGPVAPQKPDDHADMIGKLVAGVVRKYLEGKADDDVKVEIKLTCGDGTVTPVLP